MDIYINRLDTQIKLSSELYMFKEAYQNEAMKSLILNYESIRETCMSNKYKSVTGEFKGSKTITISTEEDKYVVGFGLKKAEAILDQIEEIKAFVEANKVDSTQQIDIDSLTSEQQTLVQSFTNNK